MALVPCQGGRVFFKQIAFTSRRSDTMGWLEKSCSLPMYIHELAEWTLMRSRNWKRNMASLCRESNCSVSILVVSVRPWGHQQFPAPTEGSASPSTAHPGTASPTTMLLLLISLHFNRLERWCHWGGSFYLQWFQFKKRKQNGVLGQPSVVLWILVQPWDGAFSFVVAFCESHCESPLWNALSSPRSQRALDRLW